MAETKSFTNPFPGLRPFETDEYRLFFGREGQSDALITRLQRSRLLAVVGTSGSGKSSLVRAGMLPALRGGMMSGAGSGWRISIMRPGSDPFCNLAHTLAAKDVLPEAGGGLPPAEAEAVIEATLRSGSLGLVNAARQARLGEHEKLLVVVDQFEELFRFRAARAPSSTGDEAAAFVKLLLEAARQRELSLYIVLTMRSDFLGDCAQFQGLPEAINDGQYLIPRMTRDERRMAITGPVGVTRGKMTEPLVNRLLNDVGDNPDQLPILQHALMRTWEYWAAHRRDREPLGLEHYEAIGTMSDALSRHADEAWDELPDERRRRIAELVFRALTERGTDNREIRRPTRLQELCEIAEASEAEVVAVIDIFRREGRSFLMPPAETELDGETVIDISHESLIRNWQRLKVWVNEEANSARIYRRLAEAAVDYREGAGGLLDDATLRWVLKWRESHSPNRAWGEQYHAGFDTAMAFLEESRAQRDAQIAAADRQREEQAARERRELEQAQAFAAAQAKSASRLRRMIYAVLIMFLLALSGTGFAVIAMKEANDSAGKERVAAEDALKARIEVEKKNDEIAKGLASEKQARLDAEEARKKAEAASVEAGKQETLAREASARALASEQTARNALRDAQRDRALAQSEAARANKEVKNDHRNRDALATFYRGDMEGALNQFAALYGDYRRENDLRKMAWALTYLGASQRRSGLWQSSEASYQKASATQEKLIAGNKLDKDDPERVQTIGGLAQLYSDRGNYKAAEPFFVQVHQLNHSRHGDKHPEVAASLENLALNYSNQGNLAEAEKYYKQALDIRRANPDSPDLIGALNKVAEFYANNPSKTDDALALYKEVLRIHQKQLEPDDPNIAEALLNIARVYDDHDEGAKAGKLYALARKIRQKTPYNATSAQAVSYMSELARLYAAIKAYPQAGNLYEMALDVQKKLDMESYMAFRLLGDMANYYDAVNEPDKAEAAFKQALEIIATKSHDDLQAQSEFKVTRDLAGFYYDRKNYVQAEAFYNRSLAQIEKIVEDKSKAGTTGKSDAKRLDNLSQTAEILDKLANIRRTRKEYAEAASLDNRALELRTNLLHKDEEISYYNIAENFMAQGQKKEAAEFYQKSIDTAGPKLRVAEPVKYDETTAAVHFEALNSLTQLYAEQERFDDLLLLFKRQSDIVYKLLYDNPKPNPREPYAQLIAWLEQCAPLLRKTNHAAEAKEAASAAQTARDKLKDHEQPIILEDEKTP